MIDAPMFYSPNAAKCSVDSELITGDHRRRNFGISQIMTKYHELKNNATVKMRPIENLEFYFVDYSDLAHIRVSELRHLYQQLRVHRSSHFRWPYLSLKNTEAFILEAVFTESNFRPFLT